MQKSTHLSTKSHSFPSKPQVFLPFFSFDNIEILEKIGKGGSSEVFKIYHKQKSQFLALKYYHLEDLSEELEQVLKESSIIMELQYLSHPNILQHYGLYKDPLSKSTFLLEMELGLVNLNEVLQAGKIYNQNEIIYIISGLIDAFMQLENLGIAHRDIKSENIALIPDKLTGGFQHKLYDFGISCKLDDDAKFISKNSILGYTRSYCSPEVIRIVDEHPNCLNEYNPFKADVFSLGIVILRMMKLANIKEFKEAKVGIKEKYRDLWGVLEVVLDEDYKKRLSFKEMHVLITGYERKKPENEQHYIEKRWKSKEKENGNLSSEEKIERNLRFFDVYFRKLSRINEAKVFLDNTLDILNRLSNKDNYIYEEAKCYFDLGWYYELSGNYLDSEKFYLLSFKLRKEIYGEKNNEIAKIFTNLGNLYLKTGDLKKSEENYQKSLKIRKEIYGENHLNTAISLDSLGVFYQTVGKLTEAEELYRKSMEIFQKIDVFESFLLKSPNCANAECRKGSKESQLEISEASASVSHHFGSFHLSISNYNTAELHFMRAFEIRKRLFGEFHLSTAETIEFLGVLSIKKGDLMKAEELLEKGYKIKEALLGEKNPEIVGSLGQMALLMQGKGDFQMAKDLLFKGWEIRRHFLGENNRNTLQILNYLGNLELKNNDYEKAKELFMGVYEIREKVLGLEDRDTANSLNCLGGVYMKMNEFEKAREMFQKGLAIREKYYRNERNNREIVNSFENLGNLYYRIREFEKSEAFFLRVLKIWEGFNDGNHRQIVDTLNTLGIIYEKMGDLEKSKEYYEKGKKKNVEKTGEESGFSLEKKYFLKVKSVSNSFNN